MAEMGPSSSHEGGRARRFNSVTKSFLPLAVALIVTSSISNRIAVVNAQTERKNSGPLEEMCHPKCKQCHRFDAGQGFHCVECEKGHELWFDGCYPPCTSGEYRYGTQCLPCTANCENCRGSGEHDCRSCMPGYTHDDSGRCALICPEDKYYDRNDNRCLPCNSFCKTCIQKYQTSCTSCPKGYNFSPMFQFPDGQHIGTCVEACEEGYYKDQPTELRCTSCSLNCKSCITSLFCTECDEGYYLWPEVDTSTFIFPIYQGCVKFSTAAPTTQSAEEYIGPIPATPDEFLFDTAAITEEILLGVD